MKEIVSHFHPIENDAADDSLNYIRKLMNEKIIANNKFINKLNIRKDIRNSNETETLNQNEG